MDIVSAIAAVGLLAGNAFFVAVEFSVTRVRPSMVAELESEGVAGARSLRHAVDHIDAYLSACQLGITVCSIGLGITAEPLVSHAFEAILPEGALGGVSAGAIAFGIGYGLVSLAHVVLGELAPKSLAIARTRSTGLVLLPPMRIVYLATKPVVDFLNWLGNLVLKPFGIPPASEAGAAPHSESELRRLIAESKEEGILEPEEHQFAEGVFTFGDRRAREVMVARAGVAYVTRDQSPRDAAELIRESGHSRIPVCEPDAGLDDVIGVVHAYDLVGLLVEDEEKSLTDLARPALRTSEAVLLDDLLERLRSERLHFAIVEDEHGTCVGIVTVEDILESIVGELEDEFDQDGDEPVEHRDGELRVSGSASARLVADELDVDFGTHREATIGGYLVEQLGRVPEPGERLPLDGYEAEVVESDGAQVGALVIRRTETREEED